MKPIIDEAGIFRFFSSNSHILAPIALIAVSYLMLGNDDWLMGLGAGFLLAGCLLKGIRTDAVMAFGIGGIALTSLFYLAGWDTSFIASQSYWLLAAGTVGMMIEQALGREDAHGRVLAEKNPARPKQYSIDLKTRRPAA
ncbi:MAG: hypothetical protein V1827_01195 [Candidatus Micrarchaeota archaeon]